MAHRYRIFGGTRTALRVVGSDSIRAASWSFLLAISCWSFFYRPHQLRQGVSDLREPHLGQMVTHGASRNADTTTFFESLRYGVAGSSAGCDELKSKLLDQFGFDFGSHAVILLLSGTLIQQSPNIILGELPANACRMGGGILEVAGNLGAGQQTVLQQGKQKSLYLQGIVMGNGYPLYSRAELQNHLGTVGCYLY